MVLTQNTNNSFPAGGHVFTSVATLACPSNPEILDTGFPLVIIIAQNFPISHNNFPPAYLNSPDMNVEAWV